VASHRRHRDDSSDQLSLPQLGRWKVDQGAAATAVLMDENGKIGQAYSARVTPHMCIANAQGMLVCAGGVDNIPSASEAAMAKATNGVRQDLTELLAGKAINTPTSLPCGCSIKYKNAAA
jgi:hypothetical protein